MRKAQGRQNASEIYYIMFFGEYTGGELVLEDPQGDRVLPAKNVWHAFRGRDYYHYNLPHIGEKYSIVAYSQNGKQKRASNGAAE